MIPLGPVHNLIDDYKDCEDACIVVTTQTNKYIYIYIYSWKYCFQSVESLRSETYTIKILRHVILCLILQFSPDNIQGASWVPSISRIPLRYSKKGLLRPEFLLHEDLEESGCRRLHSQLLLIQFYCVHDTTPSLRLCGSFL